MGEGADMTDNETEHHRYAHYEGRADYKLMALAMGKQMQAYINEGLLTGAAINP